MMLSETETEVSPGVWMGTYQALSKQHFMEDKNIKVLINCSPTYAFVGALESTEVALASDMIVLLLDPQFDENQFSPDEKEVFDEYRHKFNRILQNYLNYFYNFNPNVDRMIHKIPQGKPLAMTSPILTGNLKVHFFNINRLLRLLRIINPSIGVLILCQDGDAPLSTAVSISYLMDNYNFNFEASFNNLKMMRPGLQPLNYQYYDDLIVIESLKKFYQENLVLKLENNDLLMNNYKSKRKRDYISVGGESKRNKN